MTTDKTPHTQLTDETKRQKQEKKKKLERALKENLLRRKQLSNSKNTTE